MKFKVHYIFFPEKKWSHSLHPTPCENKCKAIEKDRALDEQIRTMGKKLKLSYLETAKQATDKHVSKI